MDAVTLISVSEAQTSVRSRWERILDRVGCICILALFIGLAILLLVPALAIVVIAAFVGLTALLVMWLVNVVRVRFGGRPIAQSDAVRENVRIRLEGEP